MRYSPRHLTSQHFLSSFFMRCTPRHLTTRFPAVFVYVLHTPAPDHSISCRLCLCDIHRGFDHNIFCRLWNERTVKIWMLAEYARKFLWPWFSQRWNRLRVDSVCDKIVSPLTRPVRAKIFVKNQKKIDKNTILSTKNRFRKTNKNQIYNTISHFTQKFQVCPNKNDFGGCSVNAEIFKFELLAKFERK